MITSAPMLTARFWRSRRSAAVAGIVFGVLLLVALTMLRIALSEDTLQSLQVDVQRRDLIRLSLHLVPFAGIAFLWFIGVIRDQLGNVEDACSLLSSWAVGCSSWRCCSSERSFRAGCWRCSPVRASMLTFRVRPQRHPDPDLGVRHADGRGVHDLGEHRRAPYVGDAALGLPLAISSR